MSTEALANKSSNPSSLSNEMLPVDPFRSLYVHFGMLLGVDDFQTLDAYHRGKMWYHNAWLHGKGVVWGLEASLPSTDSTDSEDPVPTGELRVSPGLAMDGMGRELLLQQPACLNVSAWYKAHEDDIELQQAIEVDEETGDIVFDAHITISFQGCLNRQVPALSETCDTSATSTAYSRVVETVEVCLHPGLAEPTDKSDYALLRLLFGLSEPRVDDEGITLESDLDVLQAKAEILAASEEEQAALCQKWFKHFAIIDGMALKPETAMGTSNFASFPRLPEGEVVIANVIGIRLANSDDETKLVAGSIDPFVRPFLLPTCELQTLISASCIGKSNSGGEAGESPDPMVNDAGGPRVDPESVSMQGTENLLFSTVGPPLMKASVDAKGLSISAFDTRDGWVQCDIKKVDYNTEEKRVNVELRDAPAGVLIRLIVKGTGESPVLGRNRIPLAGGIDSPAGSIHQGNDFVYMFRARSGS